MEDPDIDVPPYVTPRTRPRGIDAATRRIVVAASGIGFALIGLAIVWSGIHTDLGPPPVIKPPPGPMRTKPVDPGGLQVPGAHEQIMSGLPSAPIPRLAPLPPVPDVAALTRSPPPAPVGAAAPRVPVVKTQEKTRSIGLTALATSSKPPTPSTNGETATGETRQNVVQLAALPTPQDAQNAWRKLAARAPALLANKSPEIVRATIDGKTFYQVRLGFPTDADAIGFCARLRKSGISCYRPKI